MKLKITKKDVLHTILFAIFLYLMVVMNLYKSTKKIEWNIFQSEALPGFVLFCVFAVPLIYAFTGEKKEKIEIYRKEKEEDKKDNN